MTHILLVEPDRYLHLVLRQLLQGAGFAVQDAQDTKTFLACVRNLAAGGVVVLYGSGNPGSLDVELSFFTQVAAERISQHQVRYLCLTTVPEAVPSSLATLFARLHVQVLKKPFYAEELLEAVTAAVTTMAAHVGPTLSDGQTQGGVP
jgi:DNA-binding response OmpR family regulator